MVVICDIKLSIVIKQYLGESNLYVVLCRFLYAGMTVNLNKYLVAEICSLLHYLRFKGHDMLAPFTAGWQSTDVHPLVIEKSEVSS